jgi:EAL domain-containing protein (putative c-di-GMP-specific phosphodiesterase class I)
MVQEVLKELKASLHDALYLDLDDLGLETQGAEVISKFIGVQLKSAFQPIIDAKRNQSLGYEALLRPAIGPEALTPQFAFDFADKQGRLVKLDRVARTLHTLNYLQLPESHRGLLFLNVHPKLLATVNAHGKVFERVLHNHSIPTRQVVIEIQENTVDIDKHLSEAVTNYRDRSYLVAIDGFGGKRSTLDRLWRHSPDYIKIDGSIIRDAESNPKVRKILSKLIEIAQELGSQPIVQGIETDAQKLIAIDAGANLLQGFYVGRPESAAYWLAGDNTHATKAAA